jgi:hypothetical protein
VTLDRSSFFISSLRTVRAVSFRGHGFAVAKACAAHIPDCRWHTWPSCQRTSRDA